MYDPKFRQGDLVRVAAHSILSEFQRSWKWHHPLQPEQLAYCGKVAKVIDVGIYHGGDVLYQLEGVPGIWQEQTIESP
jgi:hypothetical protein